jgi:hypothetical protein
MATETDVIVRSMEPITPAAPGVTSVNHPGDKE